MSHVRVPVGKPEQLTLYNVTSDHITEARGAFRGIETAEDHLTTKLWILSRVHPPLTNDSASRKLGWAGRFARAIQLDFSAHFPFDKASDFVAN